MSGEPNTGNNSDQVEEPKVEEPKVEQPKINLDAEEVKAAINAKVEEIVGARVAREKSKTEAAEARAKEAEDKLADAEGKITTIGDEKTSVEKARDEALKTVTVLKLSIEENVSPDLVKSLRGETYEELKEAIKLVQSSKPSVNRIFDGKDTSKPKDEVNMAEIIQKTAKANRNR